jgi:hypothetical protein
MNTTTDANRSRLGAPRTAAILGTVTGAAGIAVLKLGGAAMPLVPPGAVLLLAAALLVGLVRGRWAGLAPLLVGLAEAAGILATGSLGTLTGGEPLQAIGTAVRVLGVATAIVAGGIVLLNRRR